MCVYPQADGGRLRVCLSVCFPSYPLHQHNTIQYNDNDNDDNDNDSSHMPFLGP
jgi:hypothetical protein